MAIEQFIDNEVKANDVVLFMKGTPQFPMCGFSGQVVQILDYLGVAYKGLNVLENDDLRNGIKSYSNWPTIPQLYVKGEFVGGCDIVREMFQAGELQSLLKDKGVAVKRPPQAKRGGLAEGAPALSGSVASLRCAISLTDASRGRARRSFRRAPLLARDHVMLRGRHGRLEPLISASNTRRRGAAPSAPGTARRRAPARAPVSPSSCCDRPRYSRARRARRAPFASSTSASCFDFSLTSITSPTLTPVARDSDALAVHLDVAVVDELARGEHGGNEFGAIDHGIEPALQKSDHVRAGVALERRASS